MQAHKEIEVDLADQNSSDLVSCVPIKKRLFNSMQASTSPLKETYLMPQSCSELSNKFLLREDLFASQNSDNLASDMNIKPKVSSASSSMHYDPESYCRDLNTPNENSINDNHEEIEIKKIANDFIRSSGWEDLNMRKRPSLGIVLEEEKRLSVLSKSRMLVGDGIFEKKIATSDQEYHGPNSPKQEKAGAHSLDVPVINGLQFLDQTSENNLDSENGSSVLCVNRFNWDLNVPMDAWNASAVMEDDTDHNSNRGSIHEKKLCRWVDQTAPGSIGSDLFSDASMTEQNKHNVRSRNLRILTDGKDHEGDLELQLRPPSRPELCVNWDKESLPHLSLSLPVNLSDEFCSAVKPEPCECSSSLDTESSKYSVDSVSKYVNSQPCSGKFQSETCKEIHPSSSGRVVNPKAHKELQVKQSDLELDNNQLTSSAMEPILGEPIAVSMYSEPTDVADLLPDEVPIIKSDKITCPAMNHIPVSNSDMACKDVGILSEVCTQLAGAGICKSLDTVVPIISDSKGNNVAENEICEIADTSTLHSQTVYADLKEPMTADGMSEGSAEMDCSDDELYPSKMEVIGDVHLEHVEMCLSIENNAKGTKSHAKIQKEQLIGNEQQLDDPEGVRTAEEGIAGVAGNDVISKDFRSSNSEHVATDSIGSENDPIVSDLHLDRSDKQVVFEESRNTISAEKFDANINHGEKKTSCNTASSSSTKVLVPTTSRRPNKPTQGATENYIGKKCSEELKSKTIKLPNAIVESSKARTIIGQKNKGGASFLGKDPESSGRDSDASGIANKYIDKVYHSQNKKDNDGCKLNENKKIGSFIIRSYGQSTQVSSRAEGDGLVKDRHTQDRHPQDRRHSKFVRKNYQDLQFGKYNSNYENIRRDKNRHFDQGDDTQYAPRINNSSGYQFRRHREDLESPIDFAPNGYAENAGGLSRRPMDIRPCHSSFLSRRRLQSPEEGSELLGARSYGRPPRDICPSRLVGREFHDNLSDYELMRSVPCEMRNDLLYTHPQVQYDLRDLLPRRRSSSPTQRRASPAHLHGTQAVRLDKLRSPHSRLCYPKDEAIRDPSPPYPQFSSHIREMQPVEDLELPSPPVMNRTTRRLDLGQCETEYTDPRHFTDQLVDARNYDERLHVQSLRPHLMPREVAEDILHYPADDYAYGPTDYCPDSEMFHSRGGSRDFECHLNNRSRNASDRIMSTREQGEDLRYHCRQGWRHHQLDNDRAKRRRR